jgi:hypothetical protein
MTAQIAELQRELNEARSQRNLRRKRCIEILFLLCAIVNRAIAKGLEAGQL